MRILMSTALAVAMATPVAAQNACEAFLEAPAVGSWVEYEFQGNGQSGRSKIAVVGTETRGGRELTWYEMSFNAGGQSGIMKMLGEGGFYHAMADKKIVEMVIKAAGQPAMKFSGAMIERMQSQMSSDPAAEFSKGCEDAERVGIESITVPAGTFDAVHFRVASGGKPGDAWVVEGLPFGMIKWNGSGGEAAELVDRGDDAVTQITETPMEMPGG
jgi:hypothetical protein